MYPKTMNKDDKDEIASLFKAGMPVTEIALKFNVEYPTITHHLKQMGVYKNTKTKVPKECHMAIYERYLAGVEKKVLANMFNVTIHTVNRIIRKMRGQKQS